MIDFQALAMLRGLRRWWPKGPFISADRHYNRAVICHGCGSIRIRRRQTKVPKYCPSCSHTGERSPRWKGGITTGLLGIEAKKKYQREATAKWRLKHPDYVHKWTPEQVGLNFLRRQERRAGRICPDYCEVCGEYYPRKISTIGDDKVRLHFDHDHKTGKFRGWICKNCNHALGSVKDNPEILKKLIAYLEEHSHGLH